METKWVNRDIIDQDQQEENTINMDTEEEEGGVGESEKKKKAVPPPLGRLPPGSSSGGAVSPLSCQAERCGTDLSDAKRYHRRHKVCEVHSKAPVVLVAGLRQRFCQQCSRFHEVSEFDEAKRSCRRRLAGHNERRRKSSAESCHGESSSIPKTSKENSTACKQFYMRS